MPLSEKESDAHLAPWYLNYDTVMFIEHNLKSLGEKDPWNEKKEKKK